jgi:tRNA 2-thiouridine synthesizing protein A
MSIASGLKFSQHTDEVPFDYEIDARGLSCPLPMLSTRKSLETVGSGEVLKVTTTDKGSPHYFESFVRQTGLELLNWQELDGEYSFYLRRN